MRRVSGAWLHPGGCGPAAPRSASEQSIARAEQTGALIRRCAHCGYRFGALDLAPCPFGLLRGELVCAACAETARLTAMALVKGGPAFYRLAATAVA